MDNGTIVNSLNNLVVTLRDADAGFHAAAKEVRDPSLKTSLHQFAQQSATIRGELEGEVRALGGTPADEGSFSGKCRRVWMEVKTAFTDKDESVVLKDCVSAQQSVHDEFTDVLGKEGLPSDVKTEISRHLGTIQNIKQNLEEQCDRFCAMQKA